MRPRAGRGRAVGVAKRGGPVAIRAGGRGQARGGAGRGQGGGGSGRAGAGLAEEAAASRGTGWASSGVVVAAAGTGRAPAMDATTLELDAVKFAQLAVQRDQSGRYQEAVFYYKVRRGRAGSLGAPVSPSSPCRGPHDALELPEGSRSPLSVRRAGQGCWQLRGPARPCPPREARWVSPAAHALPRRLCPGRAARAAEGEAVPAETGAEAVPERPKFVRLRRSRVLQGGLRNAFSLRAVFRWERALPVR